MSSNMSEPGGIIDPRYLVASFVDTLAEAIDTECSLAISMTDDPALVLSQADRIAVGTDWGESIEKDDKFGFILLDLPLGMDRIKVEINNSDITIRSNWLQIYKALRLLSPVGLLLAIVEPTAFGNAEGIKFLESLDGEGFKLNGVFNAPPNLLRKTALRPVIVAFSREARADLFLAELANPKQASAVAKDFVCGLSSDSLQEGMFIENGEFHGFDNFKAKLQLDRLETQYKSYKTYALSELAAEINTVRPGESLTHKENSVYFPRYGHHTVTDDFGALPMKHHTIIQVVLSDKSKSSYVALFFRSDLGALILQSFSRGSVSTRIDKFDLAQAQVSLPSITEQEEIAHTHSQLHTLSMSITGFQRDLALNPRSASEIRSQVENMLNTIGELTEADQTMALAREGESANVEFKEIFGLDVRKNTKEPYIETSSLKTIVAFLNTSGGVLLIGVTDAGNIIGFNDEIEQFYKSKDKFLLHFKNRLKQRIGEQYYPFITHKLVGLGDKNVLMVNCKPAKSPCYLDGQEFYVRTNPATDKLEGPKLVEYVQNHFKH